MTNPEGGPSDPSRRAVMTGGAGLLAAGAFPPRIPTLPSRVGPTVPHDPPPGGYNILFILVDQEHFFSDWPVPVPGREWLKRNGTTFTNHQAAACVCSPARSTIYTGLHIQHTGIFDNAGFLWQPDMSTAVKTVGHRLAGLSYHAAYLGKWHLSGNLDQASEAIRAPILDYRTIIQSYGFDDFFGVGDLIDATLGGYAYDETTAAFVVRWLRTRGLALKAAGTPWYLAVNFVNPHDVMYLDSDRPGETVQGKATTLPIAPPPADGLYQATWDDVPLPATRRQSFDAPGRPPGQKIYQAVQDVLVGAWPDEDRRWRLLRNYYYNCIRDCDRQVVQVLEALRFSGLAQDTIIVFTADHGELGGNHQMRGKGTCTYRQQNHLPLMIVHPAYQGGGSCQAITSEIDLLPTLLTLGGGGSDAGAEPAARKAAMAGLPGRSFAHLLRDPAAAAIDAVRPAALFNYNMLTYQDATWAARTETRFRDNAVPLAERMKELTNSDIDFGNRCGIRSVYDGRYRFTRYFSPADFNTPAALEDLLAHNDLELYDLHEDPDEIRNLAADTKAAGELILAMNAKLNARIAEEVGEDNGQFLPIRDGKWFLPPLPL